MISSSRTAKDNAKKKKLEIAALSGCIICITATMVFSYLKLPSSDSTASTGLGDSLLFLPILAVFIMFVCAFSFLICLAILLTKPPLLFVSSPCSHPEVDSSVNRLIESKMAQLVEGRILRFESIIFGIAAAERIISFFAVVDFFFFAIVYTVTL